MTPAVSHHAIVRWLERVEGIDIAAIRRDLDTGSPLGVTDGDIVAAIDPELAAAVGAKILTPLVVQAARAGVRRVGIRGHVVCISNNVVTTIKPRCCRKVDKSKHRMRREVEA